MSDRRMLTIVAAIVLAVLVCGTAWAEFVPKVGVSANTVTINSRTAIRFQASNGNLSAAERAQITAGRLQQLVAGHVSAYDIGVQAERRTAKVLAGNTVVCLVTRLDARSAHTTAASLASSWASNIKSLLMMPGLTLSDRDITVPLGENRCVIVGGAATGPLSAKSALKDVALAVPGVGGRYVQVNGQQLGETNIEVSADGATMVLHVFVKKYAGSFSGKPFVEVTGSPCPGSLLDYAATQAVLRNASLEPGASIQIDSIEGDKGGLPAGSSRELKADVKISGPDYITYATQAPVEVHNSVMPRDEVYQLFYSNAPERVPKFQNLFVGKLDPDKSTRVLYHHQNGMGKLIHFMVEVINPTDAPAAFRIYKGVSSPSIDTVLVGYVASNVFLRDFQNLNASIIERIPARSRLVLVSDSLDAQQTSSGILQIRQTVGSGAYVRVSAIPPGFDDVATGAITPAPDMLAMELSDHVYANPAKIVAADYVVGKQWAFIAIGKQALKGLTDQKTLYGNYGVTYDINVRVENPTNETKKVSVLFEPSAGLASGVFIIDGTIVSAKYAKPPLEVPLASYSMKPGEIRNVRIVTVPVAGSNYPATLVVRS